MGERSTISLSGRDVGPMGTRCACLAEVRLRTVGRKSTSRTRAWETRAEVSCLAARNAAGRQGKETSRECDAYTAAKISTDAWIRSSSAPVPQRWKPGAQRARILSFPIYQADAGHVSLPLSKHFCHSIGNEDIPARSDAAEATDALSHDWGRLCSSLRSRLGLLV